jgi:hypothetical protein
VTALAREPLPGAKGTRFPRCEGCDHDWHGLECGARTWGGRCACPPLPIVTVNFPPDEYMKEAE